MILTAFQLFPLLSMIFMLGIGLFVLLSRKDLLGRVFFMISLAFAMWTFGTFMMFLGGDDTYVIFWDRFIYLGVVFMPALQYHFSLLLTHANKKRRILLYSAYLLSAAFASLSRTDHFVSGVFHYRWGVHARAGLFHHFFILFFFFYIFALLYNFYIQRKKSKIKIEKFRLAMVMVGFAVLNLIGGLGYLPAYKIAIYSPISLLAPLIFSVIVAYAIIRFRFMDIRIVARKSFVYFGMIFFAFVFLSFFIWLFEVFLKNEEFIYLYPSLFVFSLLFVAAFYFLQKNLTNIANKYFFAGLYNEQETIKNLSRELTYYNNLKEISDSIIKAIKNTIQPRGAALILVKRKASPPFYKIAKMFGFDNKELMSLAKDSFLARYLEKTQEPLVAEELVLSHQDSKAGNDYRNILERMKSVKAEICLPLLNEKRLIGMIILGEKISGAVYAKEDLEMLFILANQAGIAVNNARLYEKIKLLNKSLQAKVEEQTADIQKKAEELKQKNRSLQKLLNIKNDFLRLVNHQLNTPISIIRNSVYMIRDKSFTVENGLQFIDEGLKRMDEIINDFWKAFSFEGEGIRINGEETDLVLIAEEIVNEKKELPELKKKGLKLSLSSDPMPKAFCDSKQIRQALNNLVENAIYYTPSGSINIRFENLKTFIKVYVEDTGSGIDKKEWKKIFEKFIRGSQAIQYRPGGSGLGLYITKKIVEACGGEIKIESSEVGKGTVFSFTVPVVKKTKK